MDRVLFVPVFAGFCVTAGIACVVIAAFTNDLHKAQLTDSLLIISGFLLAVATGGLFGFWLAHG